MTGSSCVRLLCRSTLASRSCDSCARPSSPRPLTSRSCCFPRRPYVVFAFCFFFLCSPPCFFVVGSHSQNHKKDVDIEQCLFQALAMMRQTPPSIVRRVHDRLSAEASSSSSSFSSTSSSTAASASSFALSPSAPATATATADEYWWEKPVKERNYFFRAHRAHMNIQISLDEKKAELAPRIVLREFLQLRPMIMTVDMRDEDDFAKAHVPNAWNVHVEELDDIENRLREQPWPYIVVIANKGRSGPAVLYIRIIKKRMLTRRHDRLCSLQESSSTRTLTTCPCSMAGWRLCARLMPADPSRCAPADL